MANIDILNNKIISDANEYCNEVIAKANAQAEEIAASYKEAADKLYASITEKAQISAQGIISAAKSSFELESRNKLLKLKVELLDKTFSTAEETILSYGKDEYKKFLSSIFKNVLKNEKLNKESCVLVANKVDGGTVEEIANENSVKFASADISRGFILKYGDIEYNLTVSSLVKSAREKIEKKIFDLLFPVK